MFREITCNRMRKFIVIKEKVSHYSNQVTFNYNQWYHRLHLGSTQYKQFPQKKKNFGKKRGKENEVEKRRRRKKGWKEFVRKRDKQTWKKRRNKKGENEMWKKRRKEERENEGEGERDRRRGRERRTENRESDIRNVSPPLDTFPSMKLGNNMTPIKRRLGKNTTPTSRSPTKLSQNFHVDPRRRRSSFNASSRTDLSHAPEEAEYPKYKLHSNEAAIYKKAKALRNSRKRFKFSINQH